MEIKPGKFKIILVLHQNSSVTLFWTDKFSPRITILMLLLQIKTTESTSKLYYEADKVFYQR